MLIFAVWERIFLKDRFVMFLVATVEETTSASRHLSRCLFLTFGLLTLELLTTVITWF